MRIDKTLRRKGVHTGGLTRSVGNVVKPIGKISMPKIQKLTLPKLPKLGKMYFDHPGL
jgi:hypothetical protein